MRPRRALHPLVVHFPLLLLGMSFVFDVLSLRFGAAMVEAALYNVLGGLASAVVAALAGLRDVQRVLPKQSPARRVVGWHAAINLSACALFAASLPARWHARGAAVTPTPSFVLSAFAVALLGLGAYLGGVMVLNYGPPSTENDPLTS